jgi:hypothetical protein
VSIYFDNREIKLDKFQGKLNEKIADFFKELNFTNPRRLKKVLNKYLILSNFKIILEDNKNDDVPNIFVGEKGNLFETILTLYFLCLFEYDRDTFDIFNDLNLKKQAIKLAMERGGRSSQKDISEYISSTINQITPGSFNWSFVNYYEKYIDINAMQRSDVEAHKKRLQAAFVIHFVNGNNSELGNDFWWDSPNFQKKYIVSEKKLDYFFIKYLLENFQYFIQTENLSSFSLCKFKGMLGKLL